jgi:L-threonylcarbamoyladenylate synthase
MRISLEEAHSRLSQGQIVAVPTETVYGLAAPLENVSAIEKIYVIKGRPSNNPLIIHVGNVSDVQFCCQELPEDFNKLVETFWPGPLTLVLSANIAVIPNQVRAGLPTAAFRMPAHPMTKQLLNRTGPLVMPSANLSGKPSATLPEHVEADFGSEFPVLDGGSCSCGVESTILIHQNPDWIIGRLGAIPAEAFTSVLGYAPKIDIKINANSPLCPGQLFRHYAPKAKLILDSQVDPGKIGAVVGFEDKKYPANCILFSLGKSTQPEMVAERLYAILRNLDIAGIQQAWVDMSFPTNGLWATIAERLKKAAH